MKIAINLVSYASLFKNGQLMIMNSLTLILVFVSGIIVTSLFSVLKSTYYDFALSKSTPNFLGMLPPESDIQLMDDGYLAMAQLGAHLRPKSLSSSSQSTDLEKKGADIEALNSLKAAIELRAAGKNVRAGRLLEHAHSLSPKHPDILCVYGEYLEEHRSDVVKADQMFLRALAVSPSNHRALRNRRRTKPLVEVIDAEFLNRIDGKRDHLSRIPAMSAALKRIQKEAYYHHIYHTAAIEGNSLTLAQTRTILETGYAVGGKSLSEQNEILGLDMALKYINTTLVHRIGRITVTDILEIHRRVLGNVDPVEAGLFRTTQVYVSNHVPPPPTELEVLMQEFVDWLNSPQAQAMHPIKYAALSHYKLVFLHPFIDGNGRTARLLMNFLLMQAGFPPVIIRKQDRFAYYKHLQTASDGDTRPFVRFIAHCTEKTIDVYLWATKDHRPEIDTAHNYPVEKTEETLYETLMDTFSKENPKPEVDDAHLWLSEQSGDKTNAGRYARVFNEDDIYDSSRDL